jgi:ribosomal protein S18 acetylase RimI-like enzyme
MSAPSIDVIRWGTERVRTGPWRGDREVAFVAPLPDAPAPSAAFVRRCLAILANRGVTRVVTAALSPREQTGFLAAGFSIEEELYLLSHDLMDLPGRGTDVKLVRARGKIRDGALEVDRAAFSQFWQFDAEGLEEARRATSRSRFRATLGGPGAVTGYCICGRSGARGFVQRLAVRPDQQRRGVGTALLVDGLHWMRRRGVERAVVNTQLDNQPALALYQRLGFRREPTGLSVLSAGLA